MTEENRLAEIKEDLKSLIKALIGLCPAYNSMTRILRDSENKSISEITSSYPELFDLNIMPVLLGMFGIETGNSLSVKNYTVARLLLDLISEIEDKVNETEIKDLISRALGESIPNPVRDYIEGCIKTLQEKDIIALKLLLINSSKEYEWLDMDTIVETLKEDYEIKLSKEKLVEHLQKLEDLGLLSNLSERRVEVHTKYREHVRALIDIQ